MDKTIFQMYPLMNNDKIGAEYVKFHLLDYLYNDIEYDVIVI